MVHLGSRNTNNMLKLPTIPSSIFDPSHDRIAYTSGSTNFNDAACFSSIMTSLTTRDIIVTKSIDYPTSYKFDKNNFNTWIELCFKYKMLHSQCKLIEDDKIIRLNVPKQSATRDEIYCSLCCYRWGISNQKMTYTINHLVKELPDISFWQILHFAFNNFITNNNHSFSYLCIANYFGMSSKTSLSHSIILKEFFEKQNYRQPLPGAPNLNIRLNKYASQLGELEVDDNYNILHPEWTPLYQLDNPNKENLLELYNKIK
jgi:hypothetical protein